MKYWRLLGLFVFFFVFMVTACAEEAESADPADTIETYIKARIEGNADKMRAVSCADWENQALIQADSFKALNPEIEGMVCRRLDRREGEFTLVGCEGKIVTTYNGETREWPLGTYRLIQEDEEWKMCGEAEPEE